MKVKQFWLDNTDLHVVFEDGKHVLVSDIVIVAHMMNGELYDAKKCVVATVSEVCRVKSY